MKIFFWSFANSQTNSSCQMTSLTLNNTELAFPTIVILKLY